MSTNGDALPQDVPRIIEALEAIYNPRSTNEVRQSATAYLEVAKQSPHALAHGFSLASDSSHNTIVRHFGLSMMAFHLKYTYQGGGEAILRQYVVHLAQNMRPADPPFLRNKVAQVWTDVAKRLWGSSWNDMDEQLVKLWEASNVHQELVLAVLETLSEDIHFHEDYVAGLRADLGSALARICVTSTFVEQMYQEPDQFSALRYGTDGWLKRVCDYLEQCLDGLGSHNELAQSCTLRSLATLQSIGWWIPAKTLIHTSYVQTVCRAIVVGNMQVKTAAIDALRYVFARSTIDDISLKQLLSVMYSQQTLQLLHDAYGWCREARPLDNEEGYLFVKRLSELLSSLGTGAEANPQTLSESGNTTAFLTLLLEVSKHPSLIVSLPILSVWHRLLRDRGSRLSEEVQSCVAPLLDLCSQRTIRYDLLPENSNNLALSYLAADCDNVGQRDIIIQQYRTECVVIIEQIVRRVPLDAIKHILTEAASFFHSLQNESLDPMAYTKPSDASLRADSYFATVEAGTRGCLKWMAQITDSDLEENKPSEHTANELRMALSEWCTTSLAIPIRDPDIKRKVVSQVVSITAKVLPGHTDAAYTVLDSLLNVRSEKISCSQNYTECTKDLLDTCAYAAQKLATVFADPLLEIYEQLETRVQALVTEEDKDLQPRYFAFLVMIIQRASNLDTETRTDKIRRMIMPVKAAWADPELNQALENYESFSSLVGWAQLPEFLSRSDINDKGQWLDQALDGSALEYQADLLRRNDRLPIKMTKALLQATTEKLEPGTPNYTIACAVWGEIAASILPSLFKMLSYATTFVDPTRWGSMPDNVRERLARMFKDRFWQSGISNESKDAFVARVSKSKETFEGFGSTVRRTIRQIRVGTCDIIILFTKLGDVFYGIPDLAQPMSQALYMSAQALSCHHFTVLLHFSSQLILGCPAHLRRQFLPSIVSALFHQFRIKLETEWATANRLMEEASVNDNLDDEMKTQSILRSMTYRGCYLLFSFTEKSAHAKKDEKPSDSPDSFFKILTSDASILEEVLLFAVVALRIRDSHSVSCVLTVVRDMVPHFSEPGPVHNFICNELLKAAITSLHEPYFADIQKELAGLIVTIIQLDGAAAGNVIASLPGLSSQPEKVSGAIQRVEYCGTGAASVASDRTARAVVLDLLEQIRGVSIHEMGRITETRKTKDIARRINMLNTNLLGMQIDTRDAQMARIKRGGSPDLEGVANLLE